MAKKAVIGKEVGNLVAYAAFDFAGAHYEPGDVVVIPAHFRRDVAFEEFRAMRKNRAAGQELGMAFYEELPPLSSRGEPVIRRQLLPVKEA